MTVRVTTTTYGRPALEVLRAAVAHGKRHDPMAPVTVLVPNNIAGIVARRFLARGKGSESMGIAGIYVTTLPRLAEQLAGPTLTAAGRRPATLHRETVTDLQPQRLEQWRLEQWRLGPPRLGQLRLRPERLGPERRASRRFGPRRLGARRLGPEGREPQWYDVPDLLIAATVTVREGTAAIAELGLVLLYLPQDLTHAEVAFAQSLGDKTDLQVIAGLTGNSRADHSVITTLTTLGPVSEASPNTDEPLAGRVLNACDPDDEVRCVMRDLMQALLSVPAHRIAVLYADRSPYARLLHEHLTAAGITTNGPGALVVNERAVSRLVLGLLETGCTDFRRADVIGTLAAVGTRDFAGKRINVSEWERISGEAGIVAGDDWDARLGAYIDQQTSTIEDEEQRNEPHVPTIAQAENNLELAFALQDFMIELQEWFAAIDEPTTWDDLAAWARGLLHSLLPRGDVARMPLQEQYAASVIERTLSGLAALDGTGPAPSVEDLARVLDLELKSALPRVGRFGEGVLVAPITHAIGLEVDVVYLVGLSGEVSTNLSPGTTVDVTMRSLLAAFSSASEVVVASCQREDQRRSTPPDLRSGLDVMGQSAETSRLHPAVSASGLEGTDPDVEGPLPDVEEPPPDADLEADVAITATRTDDDVASGAAKGARDVDLPAWLKGRYGCAVGRAVHGALQSVDLVTGDGLEGAVAAQCAAEGVLECEPQVISLVRSALGSEVVRRAAARQHWRESYVGMVEDDGTVVEGFVDLIYREDDGSLVIVDYKTDDAPDAQLSSRMEHYAPQLNACRTILETATGGPTAAPVLLFAREYSARQVLVNGHYR